MLLKKLLLETSVAPNILFRDPFKAIEPESLIKEVIGLANVEFDGPRYIIFGVNKAAMEGSGHVGIPRDGLSELKKAHRLVFKLVEPMVDLAFIYDEFDGKIIGALEIDGCEEAPYVVSSDYSDTLVKGSSFIRDGRDIREATDADLSSMNASAEQSQEWHAALGLGEDHKCDFLEITVPDSSDPPSTRIKQEIEDKFDWQKATVEAIGTINTHIMRLMTGKHRRKEPADSEQEALAMFKEAAVRGAAEADDHYFFEQCAVRLQLTLRNDEAAELQDVKLSLALPKSAGLLVVDRLYPNPNGGTDPAEAARYPKVKRIEKGTIVSVTLGKVAANSSRTVFATPLRLAIGRAMGGKKIAINYTLQAANKEPVEQGRLKIKFLAAVSEAPAPVVESQPADAEIPDTPPEEALADCEVEQSSTIVLDDMDADAIVAADRQKAESA